MSRRIITPPGIWLGQEGMEPLTNRLEHIPDGEPLRQDRLEQDRYSSNQRLTEETNIVGRIRRIVQRL
jgi:hypothetical protein